jgi:hypothetical protein
MLDILLYHLHHENQIKIDENDDELLFEYYLKLKIHVMIVDYFLNLLVHLQFHLLVLLHFQLVDHLHQFHEYDDVDEQVPK